jgi:hypothetical protein
MTMGHGNWARGGHKVGRWGKSRRCLFLKRGELRTDNGVENGEGYGGGRQQADQEQREVGAPWPGG